jgi:integrase
MAARIVREVSRRHEVRRLLKFLPVRSGSANSGRAPFLRSTGSVTWTRLAIQQWVANKFRQGTGWQTVRNAWVLLSGILETAVEYGYLQTNPARGVKFPQQGLKEKPALITGDRLARLLEQFDESYRTMVSLIAATGLRIGELLALRWSALDLGGGTLAVRESVFEGKFQRPKTKKAARTIPLGQHAVKALSEHRARMSPKAAEDLVFANRKGGPLRESKVLTKVLQPAAARAGLGRVTWHQFRHIHSSLLNDLKVPAKIAQEQLGHASISTSSTSTLTSSMPRIAKPWRTSKNDCSAICPKWPEVRGCARKHTARNYQR